MSDAEHTPGPWVIEQLPAADCDGDEAQTHVTAYANEDGTDGATVATVNRWAYGDDPPTPESEANARLIAAAPDLLEACEAFVSAKNGDGILMALEFAREAVAKARGGAA